MITAGDAKHAADRLAASLGSEGRVGDPLQIVSAERTPAGWFVPLLDGGTITGFLQFDARLTFLRHSRFPKPVDARAWLDADAITKQASTTFPHATLRGEPFLTYDAHVTRIAWAVPADGGTIYVTGDYAYQAAT